ncbi:MAG TPA: hypothetical protein VLB01_02080 [Thermodesulfobacteriota bacterium]|nr:hypothetical protein [Thermodesulfobacteriota bacterium]
MSNHIIAYFISPHGFGHASRATAVMAEIQRISPFVHFEIYTKIPRWFFEQSLTSCFNYHSLLTDVGLIQKTPLHEDINKTLESLNKFYPIESSFVKTLAGELKKLKCKLVISDISPVGIIAAKEAGIPSVLIENFTWDWIYEGYVEEYPDFYKHIDYLKKMFESADYHIQAEPVCCYRDADLIVNPVSRKPRTSREFIRKKLGISEGSGMVTVTMGGIPEEKYDFLEKLTYQRNVSFIIPGGSRTTKIHRNIILLPHRSEYFHPDLINASNLVIGKLGYSTLAEVYHARIPFGYLIRPDFRESKALAEYVERKMGGFSMTEKVFQNGDWLACLTDFLTLPPVERNEPNGADQAAGFIRKILQPTAQ